MAGEEWPGEKEAASASLGQDWGNGEHLQEEGGVGNRAPSTC